MPKREMDLIRRILIEVEQWPYAHMQDSLDIEGYKQGEVRYHIGLCVQAGLIEANEDSSGWTVVGLTWHGHEFLDASRDESRWTKAKSIAGKVGGLSFDIFKAVLGKLATGAVDNALSG